MKIKFFSSSPPPSLSLSLRVRQCTSSSGHYCGLQTLADPDGEKLWKKLYFR